MGGDVLVAGRGGVRVSACLWAQGARRICVGWVVHGLDIGHRSDRKRPRKKLLVLLLVAS